MSSVVATGFLAARFPETAATSLWVYGLMAVLLGGWLLSYGRVRLPAPRRENAIFALQFASLVAIVALAVGLRLPALTEIPPNIHGDEASIGLEARRILLLLASWVWLALGIGSVLTIDAPFSPRILVALPPIVLAPALMLDRAWSGLTFVAGRLGTYAFAVPLLGFFALGLQANVRNHLGRWLRYRRARTPLRLGD